MLEKELGRPFAIDQDEIMDIVLVKRIWPSMFDFPMLHETLAEYERKAEAATKNSKRRGSGGAGDRRIARRGSRLAREERRPDRAAVDCRR